VPREEHILEAGRSLQECGIRPTNARDVLVVLEIALENGLWPRTQVLRGGRV
jgi:hypothetical protein